MRLGDWENDDEDLCACASMLGSVKYALLALYNMQLVNPVLSGRPFAVPDLPADYTKYSTTGPRDSECSVEGDCETRRYPSWMELHPWCFLNSFLIAPVDQLGLY